MHYMSMQRLHCWVTHSLVNFPLFSPRCGPFLPVTHPFSYSQYILLCQLCLCDWQHPPSSMLRRSELFALSPKRTARKTRPDLTEDQRAEVKEAFELFDSEKSGSIDYHELKVRTDGHRRCCALFSSHTRVQVALRALGFPVKKDDVRRLVRDIDVEETGHITFEGFVEIMTKKYGERGTPQQGYE
jgi:hypothetical protein